MDNKTSEIEFNEMQNNDMAKKMSSDWGYTYTFYQEKNGKNPDEKKACELCGDGNSTSFKLTRKNSEGTETAVQRRFCSHYCCAFAYFVSATQDDKNAAKQIETSIKTRIKTLKNAEGSAQAKTLEEYVKSETTRHVLSIIEEALKAEKTEKKKMERFWVDVEKLGFVVTSKKGGSSCTECRNMIETTNDFHQTTFAVQDGKQIATIQHCENLECLLANTMKIPDITAMTKQDKTSNLEEDQKKPAFRLHSITKSWEVAVMNGKNKTWLQQSLQQIDEIDKLVQENESRIIENAESTEEEVEKVAEAVKLARDLKDKLNACKRKTAGDMNQRTNNNKNFQDKVRVLTVAFEELKKNLEETTAESDLCSFLETLVSK